MTNAGVDIEDLFNIFRGHIVDRYQVSLFKPPTYYIFHVDYGFVCFFYT